MIAISYRREDSLPVAGRLYDRLEAEFGKANVFMDFDSIPYGVDFREHIKTTIERADLVVAIIGPNWSGRTGTRERIHDPGDFVRLEISYALERGVPIVPVLVNRALIPLAKTLPRELEPVVFLNALTLDTGVDFHHHASRLIASIRQLTSERLANGGRKVTHESRVSNDEKIGVLRVINHGVETASQAFPPQLNNKGKRLLWFGVGIVALVALTASLFWYLAGRKETQNAKNTVTLIPRTDIEPIASVTPSSATYSPSAAVDSSPANAVVTTTASNVQSSPTINIASQKELANISMAGVWKGVPSYSNINGGTTPVLHVITVSANQKNVTIKFGDRRDLIKAKADRHENTLMWHYDMHLEKAGKWTDIWRTESSLRLVGDSEVEFTSTSTYSKGQFKGKPFVGSGKLERQFPPFVR